MSVRQGRSLPARYSQSPAGKGEGSVADKGNEQGSLKQLLLLKEVNATR